MAGLMDAFCFCPKRRMPSIDAPISTTTTTQAMMVPSLRLDDKERGRPSADPEALVLLALGPTVSLADEAVEVEVALSGISALG